MRTSSQLKALCAALWGARSVEAAAHCPPGARRVLVDVAGPQELVGWRVRFLPGALERLRHQVIEIAIDGATSVRMPLVDFLDVRHPRPHARFPGAGDWVAGIVHPVHYGGGWREPAVVTYFTPPVPFRKSLRVVPWNRSPDLPATFDGTLLFVPLEVRQPIGRLCGTSRGVDLPSNRTLELTIIAGGPEGRLPLDAWRFVPSSSSEEAEPQGVSPMPWPDRIPERVTELADQITPSHTALVMVDMQNDFVHDEGVFVKEWGKTNRWIKPIVPYCRRLLDAARAADVVVIHLRVINDLARNPPSWHHFWGPPACVVEGTWGAEFIGELKPRDDEIVITKYTYDGFVDTPLDSVLKKLNIRTLVFAGIDSDVCVRDTAAHGFALGYTPVFARDALAADSQTAHAGALQSLAEHYGKVASVEEITAIWCRCGPKS